MAAVHGMGRDGLEAGNSSCSKRPDSSVVSLYELRVGCETNDAAKLWRGLPRQADKIRDLLWNFKGKGSQVATAF